MNGRSIALAGGFLAGVRVAGQMTYIPATINNDRKISQHITIPVIRNRKPTAAEKAALAMGQQPPKHQTDRFRLTVWGKLADICAKSLPTGRALDVVYEPNSYTGKVYDAEGRVRLGVDGQPIMVTKVGFTVREIQFGEESTKRIAEEVATTKRPINWNTPGHPEQLAWVNHLKTRQTAMWDGRSATFGFARVSMPAGPGVAIDYSVYAVQPQTQTLPGMVMQAVAQPWQPPQPVAAAPVMTAGNIPLF